MAKLNVGESDEDVFPGPVCTSCAGVDNDVLVWCSGCGDPYHLDCAHGHPKNIDHPYRWLCQMCRQQCVSCHDQITLSQGCDFRIFFDNFSTIANSYGTYRVGLWVRV